MVHFIRICWKCNGGRGCYFSTSSDVILFRLKIFPKCIRQTGSSSHPGQPRSSSVRSLLRSRAIVFRQHFVLQFTLDLDDQHPRLRQAHQTPVPSSLNWRDDEFKEILNVQKTHPKKTYFKVSSYSHFIDVICYIVPFVVTLKMILAQTFLFLA